MSLNKAMLIGNVGKDPETRYTGSGQAVCNFSVATNETWKDRNGEKQQRTEWHKITAWGKLAEIVQQYVKKGTLVYVEGRIETRKWEDREGTTRYSTGITASMLRMLGGKRDSASTPPQDEEPTGKQVWPPEGGNNAGADITDEDIPF